jgi:ABC-type transport system involved in multi-copper enzyme maturation permease subunit
MGLLAASKEIFTFFFKQGIKSKKAKIFFLLSFLPVLVLLIAKIIELTNPAARITAAEIFSKAMLIIYIQLLVPILALLFGSLVINEEIDNKTLIYLTTSPVPKPAIIVGKYLAYIVLSAIIINAGLLLCFLVINIDQLGEVSYLRQFLTFVGVGGLALIAYSAFFTLLGTLIKKSVILGLLFIFGWENVVQYFPGVTQKFTFIHYIKSLLPYTADNVKFLVFKLEPSGTAESIVVLLLLTLLSLFAASLIFKGKEYILSEND